MVATDGQRLGFGSANERRYRRCACVGRPVGGECETNAAP